MKQRFQQLKNHPWALFSVFIVLGVLCSCLWNDLAWDDTYLVAYFQNQSAQKTLWKALTVPFWHNSTHATADMPAYWRPATTAVLYLIAKGTLKHWIFHSVSVLAAVLFAGAFFFALRRIINNPFAAFWVSLFMLIHPVSVETMCMVANISDHLSLLFLFAATGLAVRYFSSPRTSVALLLAISIFLSCAAKEIGVFSIAIPLLFAIKWKKSRRPLFSKPYMVLFLSSTAPIALYLILRTAVLLNYQPESQFGQTIQWIPIKWIFLSWSQAVFRFIYVMPMGAHIPLDSSSRMVWITLAVLVIGLIAATFFYSVFRRRLPLLIVAIWSSLVFILPSLLGVHVNEPVTLLPTRYFLLPAIALFAGIAPFIATWKNTLFSSLLPVFALLLCFISFIRILDWRNDVTLFTAETQYHPGSIVDHSNLCEALMQRGQFDAAEKIITQFERRNRPLDKRSIAVVNYILAQVAIQRDNNPAAAVRYIQAALRIRPFELKYIFRLAQIQLTAGRPHEAAAVLKKALSFSALSPQQKSEILKRIWAIEHFRPTR